MKKVVRVKIDKITLTDSSIIKTPRKQNRAFKWTAFVGDPVFLLTFANDFGIDLSIERANANLELAKNPGRMEFANQSAIEIAITSPNQTFFAIDIK